jgi:hypothetical protein
MSELTDDIQCAIEDANYAFENAASASTQAGMLLLKAQKRVRKDRWPAWLKKNFNLSPKKAREYIGWFTDMPPEERARWKEDVSSIEANGPAA